ncbi:sulfotransferase [Thalassotalea sp. Y01]|uniref:sulfotransferase n=1 Tax=Thalassotalea sp. Y01 TaxID=2729613 RepID=UPI0020070EC7|nr:sulfotransferase [Thalassotalea sp. Y01]
MNDAAPQMKGKIFIIGLPRTATTSVCVAMLDLGFNVAHTCYTKRCLAEANVIADTPVFSDYQGLDKAFPGSRFIYLERDMQPWIASIRRLLQRMHDNLVRQHGGFNPYIKHSFLQVFSPYSADMLQQDSLLANCYRRHQQQVFNYFQGREQDLLSIKVSDADAFGRLCAFVGVDAPAEHPGFKPINVAGKVIAWNKIRHPNKVDSSHRGRIDADLFLHLSSLESAN